MFLSLFLRKPLGEFLLCILGSRHVGRLPKKVLQQELSLSDSMTLREILNGSPGWRSFHILHLGSPGRASLQETGINPYMEVGLGIMGV